MHSKAIPSQLLNSPKYHANKSESAKLDAPKSQTKTNSGFYFGAKSIVFDIESNNKENDESCSQNLREKIICLSNSHPGLNRIAFDSFSDPIANYLEIVGIRPKGAIKSGGCVKIAIILKNRRVRRELNGHLKLKCQFGENIKIPISLKFSQFLPSFRIVDNIDMLNSKWRTEASNDKPLIVDFSKCPVGKSCSKFLVVYNEGTRGSKLSFKMEEVLQKNYRSTFVAYHRGEKLENLESLEVNANSTEIIEFSYRPKDLFCGIYGNISVAFGDNNKGDLEELTIGISGAAQSLPFQVETKVLDFGICKPGAEYRAEIRISNKGNKNELLINIEGLNDVNCNLLSTDDLSIRDLNKVILENSMDRIIVKFNV
ncbi:MAG: hypothetical protein MHMPM18_001858 [Marteilia pararefringens]